MASARAEINQGGRKLTEVEELRGRLAFYRKQLSAERAIRLGLVERIEELEQAAQEEVATLA